MITFTKEHLTELKKLYTDLSFEYQELSVNGVVYTPYNLLKTTSVKTLRSIRAYIQHIISKETNDEWSLDLKAQKEMQVFKLWETFVHLLVGYKTFLSEQESAKYKLQSLLNQRNELRKSTMTPTEQLAELDEMISSLNKQLE